MQRTAEDDTFLVGFLCHGNKDMGHLVHPDSCGPHTSKSSPSCSTPLDLLKVGCDDPFFCVDPLHISPLDAGRSLVVGNR